MGEAKSKKQRFLEAHPSCCFCSGEALATSIDHVPPRTFFAERAAPDGFEFPACDKCQSATRADEQALGVLVRVVDRNTANYRRDEVLKAYEGLKNNQPHLLPFSGLSARDKRRALRTKGLAKPLNMLISDIPMVGFPAAYDPIIHRYARKLGAALYYREKGRVVAKDFHMWTAWCLATDRLQMEAFLEIARDQPFATRGARTNLNFGDRFAYRCDKSEENNLFSSIAQFGEGLVVATLVAEGLSPEEAAEDGWLRAEAMFS